MTMSKQAAIAGPLGHGRRYGLVVLVAAVTGMWGNAALAISGDVLDLDGSYVIPGPSCDVVRAITSTDLNVIIPCSAEARADGGRVCDIVSASNINIGLAVGQCQDRFPVPLSPPAPGGTFETNTQVQATTFGADTAYTPGVVGPSTDVDVICNTFAGGVNKCIQVKPGSCGSGTCPANSAIKAVAELVCRGAESTTECSDHDSASAVSLSSRRCRQRRPADLRGRRCLSWLHVGRLQPSRGRSTRGGRPPSNQVLRRVAVCDHPDAGLHYDEPEDVLQIVPQPMEPIT